MNVPTELTRHANGIDDVTADPYIDDVSNAKARLLAYSGNGARPASFYKRHPMLVAGACVVAGFFIVRVPASRMVLRMGAFMLMKKVGREFIHNIGSRI